MRRIQRIAKRAAAILLCVVMLSLNMPFLPQAYAGIIPFPGGSGVDGTAALQIIGEYIDINAGIGKGELIKLRMMGPQAIAIQQTIDYLKLRAEILAAKFGLTIPAVNSLIPLLGLAGFAFVVTDWDSVYMRITDPAEFERWRVETENGFYNWAANFSNFPNLVAWITEQIGAGYTITGAATVNEWYAEVTAEGWQIIKDNVQSLFGNPGPGPQVINETEWQQSMNMLNATKTRETDEYIDYRLPVGTTFYGGVNVKVKNGMAEYTIVDMYVEDGGEHDRSNYYIWFKGLGVGFNINTYDVGVRIYKTVQEIGGWSYDAGVGVMARNKIGVTGIKMHIPKAWLGIPATPYINNTDAIQEQLDRIEDKLDNLIIQFPTVDPSGDPYIDFYKWLEQLPDWDPVPVPGTDPDPGTDPGTGTTLCLECGKDPCECPDPVPELCPECRKDPCECDTDPEEEGREKQDNSHFHLFPFCIPFDVVDMIKSLRQTPEAPRWEIPFALPRMLANFMGRDAEIIIVDLSFLEQIMPFVRLLILAGFVLLLAKATSSFIKW